MSEFLLADLLYESSMKNFGSDEHIQIAGLLKEASKNVIQKNAAAEIRNFLNNDPISIERNLHLIERPQSPVWYEWDLETRSGHGGGEHAKTGCLVTPHPFDPGLMLAVTGWSTNGLDARHAFAVALFDTDSMRQASEFAKKQHNTSSIRSLTRIMSYIEVTMPPGFSDEIAILSDNDPLAHEKSYRDATAEIPFLFSLMVMEKVKGGLIPIDEGGYFLNRLEIPPKKGFIRNLADNIKGRKSYINDPVYSNERPVWYRS